MEDCKYFLDGKCTHKESTTGICYAGCPLHRIEYPKKVVVNGNDNMSDM